VFRPDDARGELGLRITYFPRLPQRGQKDAERNPTQRDMAGKLGIPVLRSTARPLAIIGCAGKQ